MASFVLNAQLALQGPTNVAQIVSNIQSQLNNVSVNLQVNGAAQAQQQITQVNQALTNTNSAAARSTQQLGQLTGSLNTASTASQRLGNAFGISIKRFASFSIATHVVGLFTSTLGSAVSQAILFQREVVRITQVSNEGGGAIKGLANAVTSLAIKWGLSSQELLKTATIITQAGYSAKETAVILDVLAKAASAPNFDSMTETAEGAIAIMAQFKQGAGALEGQLSSLNAVAGAFAVEAGDLMTVIRATGGVFKASGGSLNELAAIFTSIRATTRESAESISTGLRTIFTRMQRPETIDFLRRFGIELVDLNGKFVGPYEAVKRLGDALTGLGEGDMTFIKIAEELGGFRQIGKVLPLLTEATTRQNALSVAMTAGTSLADSAAKAHLALAVRITKVKEEFAALIRGILDTSTFQVMAGIALSLASALIKLADALKFLIPLMVAFAAIKIANNLGGFSRAFSASLGSSKTFAHGGIVRKFAAGGLVPGSGNGDTVSAMLHAGDFVIKKSSVKSLGANALSSMDNSGFAEGGTIPAMVTPGEFIVDRKYASRIGYDKLNSMNKSGKYAAGGMVVQRFAAGSSGPVSKPPLYADEGVDIGMFSGMFSGDENKLMNDATQKNAKSLMQLDEQLRLMGATVSEAKDAFIALARDVMLDRSALEDFTESTMTGGKMFDKLKVDLTKMMATEKEVDAAMDAFGLAMKNGDNAQTALNKAMIAQKLELDKQVNTSVGPQPKNVASGPTGNITAAANVSASNYATSSIASSNLKPNDVKLIAAAMKTNAAEFDDLTKRLMVLGATENEVVSAHKTFAKSLIRGVSVQDAFSSSLKSATSSTGLKLSSKLSKLGLTADEMALALQTYSSTVKSGVSVQAAMNAAVQTATSSRSARLVEQSPEVLVSKMGKPDTALDQAMVTHKQGLEKVTTNLFKAGRTEEEVVIGLKGYARAIASGATAKEAEAKASLMAARMASAAATASPTRGGLGGLGGFGGMLSTAPTAAVLPAQVNAGATRTPRKVPAAPEPPQVTAADRYATTGSRNDAYMARATARAEKGQAPFKTSSGSWDVNAAKSLTAAQHLQVQAIRQAALSITGLGTTAAVAGSASGSLAAGAATATSGTTGLTSGANAAAKATTTLAAGATAAGNNLLDNVDDDKDNPKKGSGMAMMGMVMVAGALQSMLPPITESSSMLAKLTSNGLQAIMVLGGLAMALQMFGLEISFSTIASGIATAANFLMSGSATITAGAMTVLGPVAGYAAASLTFLAGAANKAGLSLLSQGLAKLALYVGGPFLGTLSSAIGAVGTLVLPALATVAVIYLVNLAFTSLYDKTKELAKAIEEGKPEEAKKLAGEQYDLQAANTTRTVGGVVGAGLGMAIGTAIAGPIGTVAGGIIGAAVGALVGTIGGTLIAYIAPGLAEGIHILFGGNTRASAVALAGAQAQLTATTKTLAEGEKQSADAMAEFRSGAISATDAFARMNDVRNSASALTSANNEAISTNNQNKTTGYVGHINRNIFSLGGLVAETANQRNSRIDTENTGLNKGSLDNSQKAFNLSAETRTALIRSELGSSSLKDLKSGDARKNAEVALGSQSPEELRKQAMTQRGQAFKAYGKGDTATGDAFKAQADLLASQANAVEKELENLEKEIKKAALSFNALDLGLRTQTGTASAVNLSLSNFTASLEAGSIPITNAASVLEASMGSMALSLDPAQVKSSISAISDTLDSLGTSEHYKQKFEENAQMMYDAQKNYSTAVDSVKTKAKAEGVNITNPEEFQKRMADEMANMIPATGAVDPATGEVTVTENDQLMRDRLKDMINGLDLSTDEVNKMLSGDLSVLGDKLGEAGKKSVEAVLNIAKELTEAQKTLMALRQTYYDAQKNWADAVKQGQDLLMEGREVQGKYGGAPVTYQEKKDSVLIKANAGLGSNMKVPNMKGTSLLDLKNRREDIKNESERIESRRDAPLIRGVANTGQNNVPGSNLSGAQTGGLGQTQASQDVQSAKELADAQKSHIETVRALIKIEEEELKIIEAKNKLEKDSLDSLISGDINKFFEEQAAVGATAAIATGNQSLIGSFGADALGGAQKNIQTQQAAGVQELYGVQLGGVGGLANQAAGAALGARGVTDPRMAALLSGNTAEEDAKKATLQGLGGELAAAGQLGVEMAQMEVNTAVVNIKAAELIVENVMERGKAQAQTEEDQRQEALHKNMGGLIYASRGRFIPRGTDTVPAMLTPGEFVVNREAVNRGNNLQLLTNINRGAGAGEDIGQGVKGFKVGGLLRRRRGGGGDVGGDSSPEMGGLSSETITQLSSSLSAFNSELTKNIEALRGLKLNVTLDTANVNVNLMGGTFLETMTKELKAELYAHVAKSIGNYSVGSGGKLKENVKTVA